MGEFVRLETEGRVATIRLDRPPANAMSEHVALELWDVSREVADDDRIGAVVIWGGEKRFSAGADVKEMAEFGPRDIEPVVGALEGAFRHIEAIPKVVIAAVNGYAFGGGCELALCADFRFAAEDAAFGQTEIKLGIIPGAGGTQRLPRLIGLPRARDIVYTGRQVPADEALAIGLVDRVLPPDGVYPTAVEEAARYASGPLRALRAAKLSLNAAAQESQERGLEVERDAFRDLFSSEDQKEGMRAFLEKRDPGFRGR
ncbi:MAG TPA: enoyl-CoA hydratase-related protein [Actinomycetota bacterium]